jgi:hypothetical protein
MKTARGSVPAALNQVSQAIVDAVTAVQRKDVHSQGLAKETLQAQLTGPLRRLSVRTVEAVWLRLVQEGKLVAEREFLRLPGVATISVDSPQVSAVLSAFLKERPFWPHDLKIYRPCSASRLP